MNRSVHKDTCRIWDRGVCNCGPINAAPESRDAGGAAPSADSDGGANKQDRQLVNQGRDEGMRAAFLAMQEAQTGGGEAVAPEAKPTDTQRLDWLDQHCSFVADEPFRIGPYKVGQLRQMADDGIAQSSAAAAPPAPPAPLPGKPLTKDQIAALLPLIKAEVDTLSDEGRYTFAGWLPIAVRLIEKHHGIAALSAQAAPADYPPHLADEVERELALMIDRCPEPLRRLSDWLANKLDEDDWKTAERLLLGAVESVADRAQRSGVSADPLPDRVSLSLGPVAFQFTSHQQWVNKAQSWFANLAAENPNAARKRYLCIDAKGRVCMIGKDFGRARDEDAFPVKLYLIDAAQQHQVKKGELS